MSGLNDLGVVERGDLPPASRELRLRLLSDIEPEPVDWLCRGWFARGHLHLIAGPPGLGKSTIAGDIVARVSTGTAWADGTTMSKGRVIVWSGEESKAQTLAPRLFGSGADPCMVSIIDEVTDGDERIDFSPAQHLPLLKDNIVALGDVFLLVIDPIIRIVEGAKDTYNPSAVREKLAPVVALAQDHRVAVLGVTHFNKLQSSPMSGRADRVLGSGAWVQVARMVFGVDWMEEDDTDGKRKRALMPLRNNLAPLGDGLSFRTREVVLPDRDITGVRVEWTGTVEGDADEVLAQPRPRGKRQPGDDALASAGTWLCVTLEEHPTGMKWRELTARGQSAGHSEATLRRARDVLRKDGTLEKAKSHQWRLTIDELAQGSPETCSNPASLI